LLIRRIYSDEDVIRFGRKLHPVGAFGFECTLDRVIEELKNYSDFSIHRVNLLFRTMHLLTLSMFGFHQYAKVVCVTSSLCPNNGQKHIFSLPLFFTSKLFFKVNFEISFAASEPLQNIL